MLYELKHNSVVNKKCIQGFLETVKAFSIAKKKYKKVEIFLNNFLKLLSNPMIIHYKPP